MSQPRTKSSIPPGSRVLVIDDEEIVHRSLERILSRRGHHVEAVLDAEAGLARLAAGQYDLVITDLMMPAMDGLQLLKELGERGLTAPVLMITGYPTIRTAIQALRLGAVDYVAKPFTQRELMAPVNRALRQQAIASDDDEDAPDRDGFSEPNLKLAPGDRLCLRQHSWGEFQQDGTVRVGVEASFLQNAGHIESLRLPERDESVEQGHVGFRLRSERGEDHGVYMPLSGLVVEVNPDAAAAELDAGTWLVRLLPDNLEGELPLLVVPCR